MKKLTTVYEVNENQKRIRMKEEEEIREIAFCFVANQSNSSQLTTAKCCFYLALTDCVQLIVEPIKS